MIYRKYQPEDEEQLRKIHAQRGYSFEYVDLSEPDFVSVWVAEDNGRIVGAVAARKVVEVSAFIAQDWNTPAWRLHVMQELQQRGGTDLASQNFTQMTCWVKSEVRGFARRLVRSLGWIPSQGGSSYVRGIHDAGS